MKFIIACLMAGIVLPAAAQARTCFYEPQGQYPGQAQPNSGGGTTFSGPQGQYPGQAQPNIGGSTTVSGPQGQYQGQDALHIGGYTYYGSQGLVQGQQRRCRQDSLR